MSQFPQQQDPQQQRSQQQALRWTPALERPDLLAEPVAAALRALPAEDAAAVLVAEIDPDVADTAALVASSDVTLEESANCVLVGGRRDGEQRVAAALVRGTDRADVNGLVKRALDVRKASFLAREDAVSASGMEFGAITPVGLPDGWRVLVDGAVAGLPRAVVGSGVRRSKLALPGALLARLPGAEVHDGLGRPA
ncbi:YbaK/EbsC family protein [Pseudokineococcus marinus]|uniref:YbaK/EbsC family protein n=1 Tax=Pseudokineococcus marinus TaxID=351215 RepID=UPI002ADDB399|nr:YbaK/EbsC family protein [Pseudokineococcus marinus]